MHLDCQFVLPAMKQQPDAQDAFSFAVVDHKGAKIQLGKGDVQMTVPAGCLEKGTEELVTVSVASSPSEFSDGEERESVITPTVQCTPTDLQPKEAIKVSLPHNINPARVNDGTTLILCTRDKNGELESRSSDAASNVSCFVDPL